MALNIAVPLSGVGDLLENFGLLSPISPISECRDRLKSLLISPIESESSGISSLDSEEIKQKTASPSPITTATTDEEEDDEEERAVEVESSEKESEEDEPETGSENEKEVESDERETDNDEKEIKIVQNVIKSRIIVGGRDLLDLGLNLSGKSFVFNYAQLPENDNIHFFLDNRSQYHRLGATGHIQEYTMEQCKCCDFQYPVNGFQTNGVGVGAIVQATNGLASNLLSFNINQIIGANNASNNAKCNPINSRGMKPFSANNMSQMNKNYRTSNNGPNPFPGSMPQRNNYNNLTGQNFGNKFNNNINGGPQNIRSSLGTDLANNNGNNGNIYYNNQAAPFYNYNNNDKSSQMRSYGNTSAAYNNNSYNNYNNNKNFFNYYNKNM